MKADPELFKEMLANKDAAVNCAKKLGQLIMQKLFKKCMQKCLEKIAQRRKSLEKVQMHLEWAGPGEDARAGAVNA